MTEQNCLTKHYRDPAYIGDGRFISLGNQVREVLSTGAKKVAEVGTGPGLLAAILRQYGVEVVTVDILAGLRPSVVAALPHLPLADGAVGTVACFETLEHLPLDALRPSLGELARVSSEWVVLSVPDITSTLYDRFRVTWRALRSWDKSLLPRRAAHRGSFGTDPDHHWEIGNSASVSTVTKAAKGAGLQVVRDFRPALHAYHHFFVMRKNTNA